MMAYRNDKKNIEWEIYQIFKREGKTTHMQKLQ